MQQTHQQIITSYPQIPYPGGSLVLNQTFIMGILNVTPDSFSDGGKFYRTDSAINQAFRMLDEGANIIDIGGESTRPGAESVSLETELKRVIPVIRAIIKARPDVLVSIDTYKSTVAEESIKAGARMVNDISGLGFDDRMKEVVSDSQVPIIIMHIKGAPRNMQENPYYENLMEELIRYFRERTNMALDAGIPKNQIIIDPGIGFGKRLADNYEILARLDELTLWDYPVIVGPSRKSFIGKTLNLPPEERVFGTAGAVAAAVMKGVRFIRVHDVKEMKEVVKVVEAIREWKSLSQL